MTCDETRDGLILLAYEELHEEEAAELQLHLHSCPACQAEAAEYAAMNSMLSEETVAEVPPNLLAASRLRLDEALDEAAQHTWGMRLRNSLLGAWQHVYAAPALATMLVGAGFLGGTLLTQYRAAQDPRMRQPAVIAMNDTEGVISNVSGVLPLPEADRVEVRYNRLVPMTIQGRIDDPQVRQLLALGARKGLNNDVRTTSVEVLAQDCLAGHPCEHGEGSRVGVRDVLLTSLRFDESPTVRLHALQGLQRYIGEDQRVRDAVLETLMRDPNADVRTRAVSMLQPVEGDTSVRQVLHTVSTQDENPYIRDASTHALGNVNDLQ